MLKRDKYIYVGAIFSFVLAFSIIIYAAIVSVPTEQEKNQKQAFEEDWLYWDAQGGQNQISLPYESKTEEQRCYILKKQLPETIPESAVLCMKSNHNNITAYIDQVQLELQGVYEDRAFHVTNQRQWVEIPLSQEMEGKSITIIFEKTYGDAGINIEESYIINEKALMQEKTKEKMPAFLLGLAVILMGILFAASGLIIKKRFRKLEFKSFLNFSAFMIITGMWIITDCKMMEIFYGYNDGYYFASFFLLMLMPIPLLLYLKDVFVEKVFVLDFFNGLFFFSILLSVFLLQMGIIKSLAQVIVVIHLFDVLLFPVLIYLCIRFYHKNKNVTDVLWGSIAFLIFSTFAIVFWYVAHDLYRKFFYMGLLAFMFFLCKNAVKYVLTVANQARVSWENQLRAKQARNSLRVNQIETHFFYHVMSTTRVLTMTNPEAAYKMLGDISKYFRYKTDGTEVMDELVEFKTELKSIQTYAGIKQVLLGERLHMKYMIECSNFYIPVLTIEPLVENAIEHGIEPKEGGGTVEVIVEEYEDCYKVVVRDDGVGMQVKPQNMEVGRSVSQNNIRERLEFYGNYTMFAEQRENGGTSVTIKFAKGKQE